ncbi:membrane protein [Gordonia phage Hollow]|nr:membrane protein [Gordonia phage Hollow]
MTVPTPAVLPPNLFNARSFNDFIAMLYALLPPLSIILITYGTFTQEHVTLWIGAASTILQLILQFARTQDFARRVIYTLLNLAVSVLVVLKGLDPDFLSTWMPLLVLVLGAPPAAIAVQNVNTTGDNVVPIDRGVPPEGDQRAA